MTACDSRPIEASADRFRSSRGKRYAMNDASVRFNDGINVILMPASHTARSPRYQKCCITRFYANILAPTLVESFAQLLRRCCLLWERPSFVPQLCLSASVCLRKINLLP